jgi:hypothetical protein
MDELKESIVAYSKYSLRIHLRRLKNTKGNLSAARRYASQGSNLETREYEFGTLPMKEIP